MKIWWFGGFWCFLTRFYPSNAKTIDLGNFLRCAIIQNWGVFTLQSRVGKTNEKLLWLLEAEILKHKKMSVYWAFKARKRLFLNVVLTLNGRISINKSSFAMSALCTQSFRRNGAFFEMFVPEMDKTSSFLPEKCLRKKFSLLLELWSDSDFWLFLLRVLADEKFAKVVRKKKKGIKRHLKDFD